MAVAEIGDTEQGDGDGLTPPLPDRSSLSSATGTGGYYASPHDAAQCTVQLAVAQGFLNAERRGRVSPINRLLRGTGRSAPAGIVVMMNAFRRLAGFARTQGTQASTWHGLVMIWGNPTTERFGSDHRRWHGDQRVARRFCRSRCGAGQARG